MIALVKYQRLDVMRQSWLARRKGLIRCGSIEVTRTHGVDTLDTESAALFEAVRHNPLRKILLGIVRHLGAGTIDSEQAAEVDWQR